MNERLNEIRKSLGLTMEEFGNRLGVKKNTISQLESGKNNLTEQMILAVCNVYSVSEDWLRSGVGEMFIETKESYLSELAKQFALDEMDIRLIEAFLELEPAKRAIIKEYISTVASYEGKTEEELEKERIDAEVESYRRELEAEAKGVEKSSLSEDTKENVKNKKEAN